MEGLTRFDRLEGIVVHGDKRGRILGFPTANIAVAPGCIVPEDGVYSAIVRLPQSGRTFGATASVGTNPTFDDVDSTRVEAFIHDLDEMLYGLTIELYFVQQLRPMQRFASVDALIAQTQADVDTSKALLKARALPPLR